MLQAAVICLIRISLHADADYGWQEPLADSDLSNAREEVTWECCDGKSAEELAKIILSQRNELGNTALLDRLIICLAANSKTMEALVLSKVLSGACKDPVFFSRYQSLLHASNLPFGNRDYPDFLTTDITSDDTFGWYCHVCAAFWAACFPKTAYDHSLYFNIEGMVESQMDTVFTGDLVDVKSAMALLTNELRTLSFEYGDGSGLSGAVLESLASSAVLETKRQKLMRAAREKLRNPRSSISLPGLEPVMKLILGPTGELYACMRIISEDLTAEYSAVKDTFSKFSDSNGLIHAGRVDDYIDVQWDAVRKADRTIQVKRLTNDSAARNTLICEITTRLEYMDEWLKRNARIAGGVEQIDSHRFKVFVNRFRGLIAKSCAAIGNAVTAQEDRNTAAGLILLRSVLKRISSYRSHDLEHGVMLLEIQTPPTGRVPQNLRLLDYNTYVKTDDLRLYASILTENYLASAHPNVKQYAVDLISALCLTDGELANELLLREDRMRVEPAELLAAVVEENFSDSPRGREAWHPFALLRSNNDSELNYRIWSAQVRVGYPKIELERLNVVRDHYDQIKHALTIPFANEKTGLPDRFTEHEGDLLLDPYNVGAFFERLCDACIQMVRHISDHHGLLLFIPEEIDPQAITSVLIVSFGQMALKLSLSAAVSIHFLE